MKNDSMIGTLIGVLALSALASVVLCFLYSGNVREFRTLKGQVDAINYRRAFITSLASDAVEYSKTHPAIVPVLESAGIKQQTVVAPATGSKPLTK